MEIIRYKIWMTNQLDAPLNCQKVSNLFQILTQIFRIDKIEEESMEQSMYSMTEHGGVQNT